MSYSKHFHETITVKYSIEAKVPTSDGKGTEWRTFYGSKDVDIDTTIDVDTTPFDHSVDSCNHQLKGLSNTVVATTAAEVAAKQACAETISDSLTRGFFNTVAVDLSQQIRALANRMRSVFGALQSHSGDLDKCKNNMTRDYNKICSNYIKTFTDLDKEMDHRISQTLLPVKRVDEAAQQLTRRVMGTEKLGCALVSADEVMRLDATIAASLLKRDAKELVGKMRNFIGLSYQTANAVNSMLLPDDSAAELCVPVIYSETQQTADTVNVQVNQTLNNIPQFNEELKHRFEGQANWSKTLDNAQVNLYFESMLSEAACDERTKDVIRQLMGNATTKTL